MTIAKLAEGLNLIEDGMTEDIDSDKQKVATIRKIFENTLCIYKVLVRDKKRNLSVQTSLQDFFTY